MYKHNYELQSLDSKIVKYSLLALPYSILLALGLLGLTTKADIQFQQIFSYQYTSFAFFAVGTLGLIVSLIRTIKFNKRKKHLIDIRNESLKNIIL